MEKEDNERYVRWQDYRISQFSFAINLFLTFGVAALGFWASLLTDPSFQVPEQERYLLKYALFGLTASVIMGTVCVITRLIDFRYTALKILKKYSGWRQSVIEFVAARIGGVSWALFWVQLLSLAAGVYFLLASILAVHGTKIN